MKYLSILFAATFAFAQVYDIGETISTAHQSIPFNVCYGDYPTGDLRLADFNGAMNGGNYHVIFIDLSASW